MSCKDFDAIVADLARDACLSPPAHVETCPRCAARLAGERALTANLRALAQNAAEAPPRAEAALRAAFRAQRRPTPAWVRPVAVGALAASVLIALAAYVATSRRSTPPEPDVPVIAQEALAAVVEPSEPERPRRRHSAAQKARPRPVGREIVTEFLPLPYGDSLAPLEGGRVVRVRLPRSAMTSFGLPVNYERGDRVSADVLIGDDGMARAIRFVR